MDAEFAKRWVADLRTPGLKQATKCLFDGAGHCCLGRVEILAGSTFTFHEPDASYGIDLPSEDGDEGEMCRETFDLTHPTKLRIGMYSYSGRRRDDAMLDFGPKYGTFSCLAEANDGGVPFAVIADYIEANYADL